MKKIIYLLSLLLIVGLTTSCEETEPVTPEEEITTEVTISDYAGYWKFESLEYDGIVYTYCSSEYPSGKVWNVLDIEIDDTPNVWGFAEVVFYNICGGGVSDMGITLVNDELVGHSDIDQEKIFYKFKILSGDENELKLEFIYAKNPNNNLIGSIYTFTK